VRMRASRSGDPRLYINAHVRALSGDFSQFLDFSVCLRSAGDQALRWCPRRGISAEVGRGSSPGSEGLQGALQSKEPPPTAAGKEIQPAAGQKASPCFLLAVFYP